MCNRRHADAKDSHNTIGYKLCVFVNGELRPLIDPTAFKADSKGLISFNNQMYIARKGRYSPTADGFCYFPSYAEGKQALFDWIKATYTEQPIVLMKIRIYKDICEQTETTFIPHSTLCVGLCKSFKFIEPLFALRNVTAEIPNSIKSLA